MPSYLLGNLLYDKRRHDEAITQWEKAATAKPEFATVHRNLGVGYFNVRKNAERAFRSFDAAFLANPSDARVLYERDQLWKRTGYSPEERMSELRKYPELVEARDDLTVELASLFNQLSQPFAALSILETRRFQPWEG